MAALQEQTGEVSWRAGASYRVLSYCFSIRWNTDDLGVLVNHVLGGFTVPPESCLERSPPPNTSAITPVYSLIDGTRAFYGQDLIAQSNHLSFVLDRLFWHINTETIRRTGDFLLIHAGAVATPFGEGVVLPAPTGAGKTTLVAGLIKAGFGYLSDEAAAIDPISRNLYPYAKALSLKDEALFKWFPDLYTIDGNGIKVRRHLRAEEIRSGSAAEPCPISFVIAFRFDQGLPTVLTPLSAGEGALELVRNALNLHLYGSRALPLLADVVRSARCYRLVSGNGHEAVSAVIRLTSNGGLPHSER